MDETYTPPTPKDEKEETALQAIRSTVREHPIASLATIAALSGGLYGLYDMNQPGGHENAPKNAEVASNVFSIDVKEGAVWRNDPIVLEGEDGSNIVMKVTIPGEVVGEARLMVVKDTNNGDWYGANPDWIRDSEIAKGLSEDQINVLKTDKDGIVWINEQGISKVNLIDTPSTNNDTIASPDTH